jgi:polyhydroxyalkanoate synthase
MNSLPQFADADAKGYLENLMRAGQDAVKQLDDALATAAGVRSEESASSGRLVFPFGLIVYLQRD